VSKVRTKKAVVVVIAVAVLISIGAVTYAATKTPLIGLSAIAEMIEQNYGAPIDVELTLRGGVPEYKAEIIIDGQSVDVYFDAQTGVETDRRRAENLDWEDRQILDNYDLNAPAVSAPPAPTPTQSAAPAPSAPPAPAPSAPPAASYITYDQAKEIAIATVGGGTVRDIELDFERGVAVYEVEVKLNRVEHELKIDAISGEVLRHKIDD
jgi:uncharacterized membrane protein YkoI